MATSKKKLPENAPIDRGTVTNPRMANSPFPGQFNNPLTPGSFPMAAPTGFNTPPFGAPMAGGPMPPPQGMIPPMPGVASMPTQSSGDLFNNLGTMIRLGIEAVNAALIGGNQLIQGLVGSGYHGNYPYHYPHHHDHGCHGHHMHHCCDYYHHDHYHDSCCHSCCDVYGESCCNPSVHGCG